MTHPARFRRGLASVEVLPAGHVLASLVPPRCPSAPALRRPRSTRRCGDGAPRFGDLAAPTFTRRVSTQPSSPPRAAAEPPMSRFTVPLDSLRHHLFHPHIPSRCPSGHPMKWDSVGHEIYVPHCPDCGGFGEEMHLPAEHRGADFTAPFCDPDICPHDGFPIKRTDLPVDPLMLNSQRAQVTCVYCGRQRAIY